VKEEFEVVKPMGEKAEAEVSMYIMGVVVQFVVEGGVARNVVSVSVEDTGGRSGAGLGGGKGGGGVLTG
jgi:hypothetical protein